MKYFLVLLFAIPFYTGYGQTGITSCIDMQSTFNTIKSNFNHLESFKAEEQEKENGVTEYASTVSMCGKKATIKESSAMVQCTFNYNTINSPGTMDEYHALFVIMKSVLNSVFSDTHDPGTSTTISGIETIILYEKGKNATSSKRTIILQVGELFGPFLSIDFEYSKK